MTRCTDGKRERGKRGMAEHWGKREEERKGREKWERNERYHKRGIREREIQKER